MSDDAPRYIQHWQFTFDPRDLETIDDLIQTLENFSDALTELREWRKLGVQLSADQADANLEDGYLCFSTSDKAVADKLGFDEEEDET
jgi:hypothetical protein